MILEGKPFSGKELEDLKQFLRKMDLDYDESIEYSVCILNDEYEIIASGSVDLNVIKCVAVDPDYQGQGLSAQVISQLVQYEYEHARTHIMIYTKPKNYAMFSDMGFYTVLKTKDVLFMENKRQGFSGFINSLKKETPSQALSGDTVNGCIVANCNPFTKGHRYLVEEALKQCDYLHLFILSDNRSYFPAVKRFEMVLAGVSDLDRVIVHRTSDYMISASTFPTYFFKDKAVGSQANCQLDIELFGKRIAPELQISKRFVGTEPFCKVTGSYNEALKNLLPGMQIELEEIVRMEEEAQPVSASRVRALLEEGKLLEVQKLVPESTYRMLGK